MQQGKDSICNVEKALGAESLTGDPKVKKKRKRSVKKRRSRGESEETESRESKRPNKSLQDTRNNKEDPKKWGGLLHTTQDKTDLLRL